MLALGESADLQADGGLSVPNNAAHSGILPNLMTDDDSRLRRG